MNELIVAIQDDALQLSEMGLIYAIRRTPMRVRKMLKNPVYTWQGACIDWDNKRWLLIRIQFDGE